MADHPFVPLRHQRLPLQESLARGRAFHAEMDQRRTTRHFSTDPVPREAIELAIRTAGTAPSGAHQQPWTFVAIADPALKQRIREAAEAEEREFYGGRAPEDWIQALAPLGTDALKPHLTDAPWLVVVFRHAHGVRPDGGKVTHYYTQESVGIAVGFFIAELLGRPANERAYLIMPVGYPAADARVPDIHRKPLDDIAVFR
jgi:hypothetical protein